MIRNILTIDIEGWYQSSLDILGPEHSNIPRPVLPDDKVVKNTRLLLRILAEHGVHATCFVLGTVAEKYPCLVRDIQGAGHEIATHGYSHELVFRLTLAEFKADLQRAIQITKLAISDSQFTIYGYRAPCFSITQASEWALETLPELGIKYDSSIFPIQRRLYGFPGLDGFPHVIQTKNGCSLLELPISTIRTFGLNFPVGGGGYFRLFPYRLIQKAIRTINKKGKPAVFYLHPYELDVDELRSPLPGETWKTHFVRLSQGLNRAKTELKLRRLLADFKWTSVKEWMAERY